MQRQRAPKACLPCRERKVKCTVSTSGIPCKNCLRTNLQCSVNYARKRRKAVAGREQLVPLTSVHTFSVDPGDNTVNDGISDSPVGADDLPIPKSGLLSPRISDPSRLTNSVTGSLAKTLASNPDCDLRVDLPSYIAPLPQDLDPDVLRLLCRGGAFSMPGYKVRENLVHVYICYVHPFLPLLDLEDFLQRMECKEGSNKLSLILFQAVMFAATTFVDMSNLEEEGFASRKDARKAFFNKVRLLYDADIEADPLTLIQALVLMTYWYDKPADIKGRSHWMRIALSLASDIGLTHSSVLLTLPPPQQRLRRRLWWCCFMRDELISFSERRPTSIPWDEADFPTLSIDDFDSSALAVALEKFCAPNDGAQSKILTDLCLQKIKLCVLIGRVLQTQYQLSGHRRTTVGGSTVFLVPKFSGSASSEYMARDQELREWGAGICFMLKPVVHQNPHINSTPVAVHCAVIELVYLTVLGMVHRPQIFNMHLGDSAARALQEFSHRTLGEAALRISEIAEFLQGADLLRFLPPIGLTALLFAAMQHLRDIKSPSSSSSPTRSTSQEWLDKTMNLIILLQETYPQASHVVTFLEHFRSKKVQLPDEGTANGQTQMFALYQSESTDEPAPKKATDGPQTIADVPPSFPGSRDRSTLAPVFQMFGGSTDTAVQGTEKVGIDYSRSREFEFESLLNFDDVSEVFLSGNVDASTFEGVNWTEIFQERNWDT